ncbi:N-acetyltransferase O1 (Establishment of cohesion protein 1) [Mycoblastus sanguinarius]|nr:N-acetyltransferase O1 (Establishment of cohesion protein 1) [Mycoblastus sanguinarius]
MPFGVSNSFKRGTLKTYSRQRARVDSSCDVDRPRKRIRMDATGSVVEENFGLLLEEENTLDEGCAPAKDHTPTEDPPSSITAPSSPPAAERALLSSDALQDDSELSSPLSSPPRLPSPVPASRKPAFSFLKRKRQTFDDGSASEPLSDITPNVRKMPRVAKRRMTQMQIDLGGEVRRTCRTCGMEYIPSVKEDGALHSKFCAINAGGVEMGKTFLKDDSVKRIRSERASGTEGEMVVVVDRRSSVVGRNKTRGVLEVVNAELSATDIEEDRLWGALDPEKKVIETRKGGSEGSDRRGERFKAFFYLVDDKCVAFCLAEKISNAFPVIDTRTEGEEVGKIMAASRSSSISVSTTADVVLLGISRIWTSKSYRGQGLAVDLLDCARGNFFYGVEVPKNLVAFSQPTESGGRLAERWFEAENGWHVYRGDQ